MNLSPVRETFGSGDQTWLGSEHGTSAGTPCTLDKSLFTEGTHYPDGYFPSGLPLGKVTASGKYGPYAGTTDEVQRLTVGGSGLTSFTITYSGQTTASIDDAATAAQVQTAVEGLSNVEVGEVAVTGEAGGPWDIAWIGDKANTNIDAVTTTPTGGTGTVTVSTPTAGGADGASNGTEVLAGFLFCDVPAPTGDVDPIGTLLDHCIVIEANLPVPIDDQAKADVANVTFR